MASFIKDIEEIRQRARQKIDEGAVTDNYQLDKDQVVSILNEALATEIVCVLRYMHHYFMATGVHGRAVADEFKEHADDEREHADEIAERIQQLGGKTDFNPASLLQRSVSQYQEGETLADMIREDLIAERTVIDVYQRMIEFFGEKDPTTRRMIEHIKGEEEEHASDLSDFLYIVDPRSGETEGMDPGTNPLHQREGKSQKSGQTRSGEDRVARDMVESSEEALEQLGERSSGTRQSVKNVALRRPGSTEHRGDDPTSATIDAPASNLPGVSGRPMNRRRTLDDIDESDVARRGNTGGSSGTNRSPKVMNKNRKNKRAA